MTGLTKQEKKTRIAMLGWGSLLWEGGQEFDRRHGPWEPDGPCLKLEFSRISETRLKALTLVIDGNHGVKTGVAWCLSERTTLADAICDLREREGTTIRKIGRITIAPEAEPLPTGPGMDTIAAWARIKNLEAVIWTALESNFREKTGQAFSVDAALSHLKALTPEGKVKAAEYIWRAPAFVKTPLRTALETAPWFAEPDTGAAAPSVNDTKHE